MLRKLAFLKKPQLSLQKSRSFRCKKAAAFAAALERNNPQPPYHYSMIILRNAVSGTESENEILKVYVLIMLIGTTFKC